MSAAREARPAAGAAVSAAPEPRPISSGPRTKDAAVRRGALVGGLLALLVLAAAAPAAEAHPLGNFTTNQLVRVSVDERRANVGYVLDLAEIPTFQLIQRHDDDGDGEISGAERGDVIAELEREVEAGLTVTVDGSERRLRPVAAPRLSFPAGQTGLALTRLETRYAAPLPGSEASIGVRNDAYANRTGWRAIEVLEGSGTDVVSSVPATEPTDGLRAYPAGLLQAPPDVRRASFESSPGTGTVSAPDGIGGGATTTDRAGDGFAAALTSGNTEGLLIVILLATAFGWGALHALSPGHGKAMVAGYLAGSRGTPRHAFALGATVTATHTASVFALGLLTLAASELIVPERLYPWLGVVSGLIVVAVGLTVMRSRLRRWRAVRAGGASDRHGHSHGHEAAHDHGHGSGHAEAHTHDHVHDHVHDHGHSHHHHHGAGDAPIRMRELFGLGVSGGLVPCPSALVVLIAAISQHRLALGMALIFAFSLGLAATVSGVGLLTIYGGRLLRRIEVERRLFGGRLTGALPALSAILIVAVGILITSRAIPTIG
jgi:ABC-type nickel/cobalt efflux system permease component RcnA